MWLAGRVVADLGVPSDRMERIRILGRTLGHLACLLTGTPGSRALSPESKMSIPIHSPNPRPACFTGPASAAGWHRDIGRTRGRCRDNGCEVFRGLLGGKLPRGMAHRTAVLRFRICRH